MTSATSVAGEFLAGLYAPFSEGWLTLFTLDRASGTRAVEWAPVDQPGALALTAEFHVDHCIWFGVATRTHRLGEGRRGTAKECAALPGLWVDLDVAGPNHGTANLPATVEEALELQERFPLPATAIIATGGGLQAHWAFSEPLPVDDEAVALLGRWGATWAKHAADAGRHIDNVFNVDRIMRLPGTWNTKSDPPQHVEVLGADWSLRYGVDDLDQWMVEPPPVTIATARERAVPYIGPERPGDAYNARHSCAELLAAAGFEAHRALRNGDQHFRWPGATNDIGATVYADDGHATIWSETFVSTHPAVALRRPYDPFGLHAALAHAGDAAAAASALRLEGYGAPPQDLRAELGIAAPSPAHPSVTAPPEAAEEAEIDHGWAVASMGDVLAEDYEAPAPDLFARADGTCLLYRGRVNALHGESGSGKSWVAMSAAAQAMAAGEAVLMIDLEDHLASVAARFRALGLSRDTIAQRLDYVAPEGVYGPAARHAVETLVRAREHALVIVDSTGEAMALDGAKQNDDDAVAQWFRRLPRALAGLGPAVIVIDHVPKAEDAPKLYAIGSQRKRAAVDGIAYRVEAGKHPARGRTGYLRLIVAKDRNGSFQTGSKAADITIDSSHDGKDVRMRIDLPSDSHRPTVLMERVSRYVELHPEATQRTIIDSVEGNRQTLRVAVEQLIAEGHIKAERHGQAFHHVSVEPFRNDTGDGLERMIEGSEKG